jgi:hypothetical protein
MEPISPEHPFDNPEHSEKKYDAFKESFPPRLNGAVRDGHKENERKQCVEDRRVK